MASAYLRISSLSVPYLTYLCEFDILGAVGCPPIVLPSSRSIGERCGFGRSPLVTGRITRPTSFDQSRAVAAILHCPCPQTSPLASSESLHPHALKDRDQKERSEKSSYYYLRLTLVRLLHFFAPAFMILAQLFEVDLFIADGGTGAIAVRCHLLYLHLQFLIALQNVERDDLIPDGVVSGDLLSIGMVTLHAEADASIGW